MSVIRPDDPYGRPPMPGSPAGWYPMRNGAGLRAKAFGSGPAPVMGWWNGDAWEGEDLLFTSARGPHARRRTFAGLAGLLLLLPALWLVFAAIQESTSEWAFPAWLVVFAAVVLSRRPVPVLDVTSRSITLAHTGTGFFNTVDRGVWTVPAPAVAEVRISRTLPRWCERWRIDVLLEDGGRLVGVGFAGGDVLQELLAERDVLVR
jgi:hypothetical protein